MKKWWWFSSFKCSHFVWLSCVCVCVVLLSLLRLDFLFFLLQLGPNSGGPLSIHTRIIIHFKFDATFSPKRKQTPWTRERETSRELCFYVCVFVFRVWGIQILSLKKRFLLFLSHLFNLLWQVVVAARSLACDKKQNKKQTNKKTWKEEDAVKKKKKMGEMCARPPLL